METKKILIVEDEVIVVDLLQKEFERAGYQVASAADGVQGMEMIESFAPDLVLLDLLLPKKSGFEVVGELKAQGKLEKLPVIVISNSGQPTEIENLMELGVKEVLTKINFNPTGVVEKVGRYFDEQPSVVVDSVPSGVEPRKSSENLGGESATAEVELEADQKKTVLIVEDDPFIGDLVVHGFKKYFNVHRVTNAQDAEKMLNAGGVDALLLDIIIPGKDGLTYLRELRATEKGKDLCVVLASNLGQEEEISAGMDAGADDYVIKANHLPDEIARRVLKLLEEKSGQSN